MNRFKLGSRVLVGALGVGLGVGASLNNCKRENLKEIHQRETLVGQVQSYASKFLKLTAEEVSAEETPCVIFVLGGPGSGKGTQCKKIVGEYGYVHLSAGDLLRAERANPESLYGKTIQEHLKNGSLVPTSITCSLLERAMMESSAGKFLIDGFPRGEENLTVWNEEVGQKVKLQCVLFFHCSEEVCAERCLARGAAGSGRSDDNVESLKKRFATYEKQTMPIVEKLESLGLVKKIDASRTPDEIFADVQLIMKEFA